MARSTSLHFPKNFMTLCYDKTKQCSLSLFHCRANGELGRATGMLAATYLSVTLPQLGDQFITFVRVQMWRQVGVHAELRAYWSAEAILKTTNRS